MIKFDARYRLIRIQPFNYTITDATEGNDYVTVSETIDPETPDEGILSLPKTAAYIPGTKDLSAGYDFSVDPRNFLIIAGDGIEYETIYLDQYCANAQDVADLISQELADSEFATQVEAYTLDTKYVGLRQKSPYWGESFSFIVDYGDPDALEILGIPPGTYAGTSDNYTYSSWSGNTFYLDTNLTRSYNTGIYCAVYYSTLEVQTIYNKAMDWADDFEGMSHPPPMSGAGYYPLGGGAYTDKIFVLTNGWKILPHPGNYELTLIGTTITDDGSPRIRLPRSGSVSVIFQVSSQGIISETPVEEVIQEIKKHDQKITGFLM